jgi:hypothetical protein
MYADLSLLTNLRFVLTYRYMAGENQEGETKVHSDEYYQKKAAEYGPPIEDLSHTELVKRLEEETLKARDPVRLTELFSIASMAEADKRLTVEESVGPYSRIATSANRMASRALTNAENWTPESSRKPEAEMQVAQIATNVSLHASNRLVRSVEGGQDNSAPSAT